VDHLDVGLEVLDLIDDVLDQVVVLVLLGSLHDSHGDSLNDVVPLLHHLFVNLLQNTSIALVLHHLLGSHLWDEAGLDQLVHVLHIDEDLLVVVVKLRLA